MNLHYFVSIINNGLSRGLASVSVKKSKLTKLILNKLFFEGLIISYKVLDRDHFEVYLKYTKTGQGVFNKLVLISKPSLLKSLRYKNLLLTSERKGHYFFCSSNLGILSSKELLFSRKPLGGLLLFLIVK